MFTLKKKLTQKKIVSKCVMCDAAIEPVEGIHSVLASDNWSYDAKCH